MAIEKASASPLRLTRQTSKPLESATVSTRSEVEQFVKGSNGRMWRRLVHHRSAVLGLALISLLAFLALLAPVIAPYGQADQNLSQMLLSPSLGHLFGTDELGRDIFSRILFGARISLVCSVVTVLASTTIGTIVGLFSGYYGGWLDELTMRFTDILLAFPGVLLAVTVVSVLGTGLVYVALAIGIYIVPGFVRIVRSAVLTIKQREFIEAAQAVGARDSRIIFRHVLPNILSPILVQATLRIGTVILLISGLSFLGMGPKPPTPEWGLMLSTAKDFLRVAPHVSLIPGATIMVAVLGFNLLGDALRDVFDPRQLIG
jgi:peptide/nickel transport system permease protein